MLRRPLRPNRPATSKGDPYKPGSTDYADRHRETVTTTPDGFTRVDLGEPIR